MLPIVPEWFLGLMHVLEAARAGQWRPRKASGNLPGTYDVLWDSLKNVLQADMVEAVRLHVNTKGNPDPKSLWECVFKVREARGDQSKSREQQDPYEPFTPVYRRALRMAFELGQAERAAGKPWGDHFRECLPIAEAELRAEGWTPDAPFGRTPTSAGADAPTRAPAARQGAFADVAAAFVSAVEDHTSPWD